MGCGQAGFSWNTWALELWGTGLDALCMRSLGRPGIKPVAPASAGRFLATGPPGESKLSSKFFKLQEAALLRSILERQLSSGVPGCSVELWGRPGLLCFHRISWVLLLVV